MLFWIALLILVVGTLYYAITLRSPFILFMGLIAGPIALCVAAMVLCIGVQAVAPYQEAKYGLHLEALTGKDGKPSDFFLGSGETDANAITSFTYGDNKHGYHTMHVPSEYSVVHQNSTIADARVVVTDYSGYNWFISPFHSRVKNTTTYEFYVPIGSVSGNLVVDSK